ncbi:hypothetical protein [Ciceribacter sp. L1K22]|uniref:hypothetical protein n=1 Tax=Ciceribacter sp. L1K22 TaxID=2820275 RepID=UPI001ABDC61C|nr:hypothetical protein [Ciceribacter sp. L1K22]MBO3761176.1 hypothetical protein [Ciceribacter sp. L1K22]
MLSANALSMPLTRRLFGLLKALFVRSAAPSKVTADEALDAPHDDIGLPNPEPLGRVEQFWEQRRRGHMRDLPF